IRAKISTDVNLFPEEPDALIGHVRVCGGSGWVTARFYPASIAKFHKGRRKLYATSCNLVVFFF
ncbi:MAG: hypothetical protein LBU17_03775, partial [Treponema sp.]|nr:hypothetical protein [Treponema sp.]